MRVAVLGSGRIGGYSGALLANVGEDVVFVARGTPREAMLRRGLTLRTAAGESTVPPPRSPTPGAFWHRRSVVPSVAPSPSWRT